MRPWEDARLSRRARPAARPPCSAKSCAEVAVACGAAPPAFLTRNVLLFKRVEVTLVKNGVRFEHTAPRTSSVRCIVRSPPNVISLRLRDLDRLPRPPPPPPSHQDTVACVQDFAPLFTPRMSETSLLCLLFSHYGKEWSKPHARKRHGSLFLFLSLWPFPMPLSPGHSRPSLSGLRHAGAGTCSRERARLSRGGRGDFAAAAAEGTSPRLSSTSVAHLGCLLIKIN